MGCERLVYYDIMGIRFLIKSINQVMMFVNGQVSAIWNIIHMTEWYLQGLCQCHHDGRMFALAVCGNLHSWVDGGIRLCSAMLVIHRLPPGVLKAQTYLSTNVDMI